MTRTTLAVLMVAAVVVTAPMAAAAPSSGTVASMFSQETETPSPGENASVTPGEKLSGVVGVQQAELEGEVDERTFGVKVAQASSDGAKADVVRETLGDVEQRVDELADRKQTLEEARANGSISEGEYRARMASVAAELSTAKRLANASADTAEGLPADVLESKGITVTAIRTLQDRAANLSGPEVAAIAQSIAGKDVGRSMAGAKKPGDVGGQIPDGAPNGTDDQGAPDGSGGGAPNGTDGAPNGSDGAPDGSDGANDDAS